MLTTSRGCREIPSTLCLRNLKRDLLNRPHPSRKFNLGPRARLKLSILGPSAARARGPMSSFGFRGVCSKGPVKNFLDYGMSNPTGAHLTDCGNLRRVHSGLDPRGLHSLPDSPSRTIACSHGQLQLSWTKSLATCLRNGLIKQHP